MVGRGLPPHPDFNKNDRPASLVAPAGKKPGQTGRFTPTNKRENNFDPAPIDFYAAVVRDSLTKVIKTVDTQVFRRAPLRRSFTNFLGRKLFLFLLTIQGLGAFALITLGVMLKKFGMANQVVRPMVRQEIARAGLNLLPMFLFLAVAVGLLVIGQTVAVLARGGAIHIFVTIMVV